MINTIILDIGNVLANFRWMDSLRECGYSEEVINKIGNATVKSKIWKEWDRGSQEEKDLISQFCSLEPSVEKEIHLFFQDIKKLVKVFDYSTDFVHRLKENGYKIYLLSNYGRLHFQVDREQFEFMKYVDGGIISYEVHHIKPEPEIYEDLIRKYNIIPENSVFLDDLQVNLDGAIPFGFHTIQVKTFEQALEDLRNLGVNI